jgi:hypothetical protein
MKTSPTGRWAAPGPNSQQISKPTPEVAAIRDALVVKLRAGHDFPCAIHKGPKGDCSERNCRCF